MQDDLFKLITLFLHTEDPVLNMTFQKAVIECVWSSSSLDWAQDPLCGPTAPKSNPVTCS